MQQACRFFRKAARRVESQNALSLLIPGLGRICHNKLPAAASSIFSRDEAIKTCSPSPLCLITFRPTTAFT
jgi:hypothetical protein